MKLRKVLACPKCGRWVMESEKAAAGEKCDPYCGGCGERVGDYFPDLPEEECIVCPDCDKPFTSVEELLAEKRRVAYCGKCGHNIRQYIEDALAELKS